MNYMDLHSPKHNRSFGNKQLPEDVLDGTSEYILQNKLLPIILYNRVWKGKEIIGLYQSDLEDSLQVEIFTVRQFSLQKSEPLNR